MGAQGLRSLLRTVVALVLIASAGHGYAGPIVSAALSPGANHATVPSARPKTVLNAAALTGLWYAPSQSGHGFALTFDSAGRAAATWYVYQGAAQVWLIGSGTLEGNQAVLPSVITSGASFPPNFVPGQVTLQNWGTLTLNVVACDRINVAWNSTIPGYGSGSVDVVPLIIAGGLPCVVTTSDDHGDTCSRATAVALPGQVSGRIDPEADEDFFRVNVTTRGALTARSVAQVGLDPQGAILDANCDQIDENDDADDHDFAVQITANPGTYYVRVGSYAQSSLGNYSLNLTFEAAGAADDFGDICSTASNLALGATVAGRIDPATDQDFFRVVLGNEGALLATSDNIDSLDPIGTLYDASCQLIVENDDFDEHNFSVSSTLPPGTYFVGIRSYEADSTGRYTLSVRGAGTSSGDDHGDFCGVGTPFAVGTTLNGRIGVSGDSDFFRFSLSDPGTFSVVTQADSTLDPLAGVFDAACSLQTEDDDSGIDHNASLTVALPPGDYAVRVRGYEASTGNYMATTRFTASRAGSDEHGNACANATPIAPYGSVFGLIDPGSDQDYFRLDTEEGGTLLALSEIDGLDPVGAILDSNCNLLAENDDSSDGEPNFRVSTEIQPGTYYLRVRSFNAASTGTYLVYYGIGSERPASSAVSAKQLGTRASPLPIKSKSESKSKPGAAAHPVDLMLDGRNATPIPSPVNKYRGPKVVTNPTALSGLWFDPAQSGQGVQITFDATGSVALTWYVYQGSRQVWLIGSAPLQGNRVTIPMVISSGAQFLPAFNPASVTLTPWGNITLDVRSCGSIVMTWAPTAAGYQAGSMTLQPLIVSGGLTCSVSQETDDHGNSCTAATAAALNAGVTGRIDPNTDEDFFRVVVGSAGNLTVRSSGTNTLNATGALLDSSCAVLASNDDSAGREFSIARAVAAGTYYVRVGSSGRVSVGDYTMGSTFVPSSGGGSNALTLNLHNDLLYDLDFRINGGNAVRVVSGATTQQSATVTGALSVSFQLVGASNAQGVAIGDLQGGTFDPVASPSGTLSFSVGNQIGGQRYFAPSLSSKTLTPFLAGVNMGTSNDSRCNCTVPGAAKDVKIGYYVLRTDSNVRAYAAGSNYTGAYRYWGSDTGGGVSLLNIPLINLIEEPSGRVSLKYIVFGQ